MGLTNWQLFFQDLQSAVTDQPLGDNEVLTVVREANDSLSVSDPDESAYTLAIMADNPRSFWRLNDVEGFAQAVRSDGAVACWRFHGDATDYSGGGRTGTIWGRLAFDKSGPLANLTSAPTF